MRDEDVQREINRAIESKTTTGWRKRQIARHDDDDIQEYVRPWRPLTDEEISAFSAWHDNREEEVGWVNPSEIVAYIETKLKEKNHG